jgi:hypothetical protein
MKLIALQENGPAKGAAVEVNGPVEGTVDQVYLRHEMAALKVELPEGAVIQDQGLVESQVRSLEQIDFTIAQEERRVYVLAGGGQGAQIDRWQVAFRGVWFLFHGLEIFK